MRLATSTWRTPRLIVESGLQPVGICRGVPKWSVGFDYERLWALAPTKAEFTLRGEEFEEAFLARLCRRGANAYFRQLLDVPGVTEAGGAVLLCWEPAGEPCHRRLVARLFEDAGYGPVPELRPTCPRPGEPS